MAKTALIVDDSKSARVVLKRLLENHDLEVDTAESAEAALDYLNDHRPDVVFMDHLMPGMDGFEAVSAIKNNPDTATIPIMMYTSQQGELYVGQARALGAVGVLPKQVEPVEVSKVLQSLRVIGGDETEMKGDDSADVSVDSGTFRNLETLDYDIRELISDLFDQQRAVLRRDLLDSYEAIASRVVDEIRESDEIEVEEEEIPESEPRILKAAAAVLAVVVLIFASLYFQREQSWQQLQSQNAELMQALDQQQTLQVAGAEEAQQQLDTFEQSIGNAFESALSAIEWGMNQNATYVFNDEPLGDDRLRQFEELVDRLMTMGFSGQIRVETHTGDFCMVAADADIWAPAPADMAADQCERIGFTPTEAVQLAQRQSVSFANFINVSNEQTAGRISFDIVALGNFEPVVAYPNAATGLSAGDWNEIAAANNRIVVSLYQDNF